MWLSFSYIQDLSYKIAHVCSMLFSAADAGFFVGYSYRWWVCIVQQVSIQKCCRPFWLACFAQNLILSYPSFFSQIPFLMSSKVTSSSSSPHVCESIAYGGIASSRNRLPVSPILPSSLRWRKRIAGHRD
jgi:hypothetical protein